MSQEINVLCNASSNSELLAEFVEKNRNEAAELAKNIFTLLAKNKATADPAKQKEQIAVKMELLDDEMETMPTSSATATVRAENKFTLTLRGGRNYLA